MIHKIRPHNGERLYYLTNDRQHIKIRRVSQAGKHHEISIHTDDIPALINALADLTEQENK